YDPRRVRVADAGVLWLSRTPLVVGSRSWGDWARRSALWAKLVYVETGGCVLVVNTHFDHVSMLSRRRSAQLVHRVAPHALLMGDFNAWPRRFVHTVLLDGRYDPLEGARHTHNAFTRRDRGRIDWILVPEELRVRRAEVLDARRPDGGPASDHLPVLVDVEPPAAPREELPRRMWTCRTPVETKLPPAPFEGASLPLLARRTRSPEPEGRLPTHKKGGRPSRTRSSTR
ncbi:MAG TPA: endonuclease/exonuclease/phosphatase family protein, partial [Candidatus Thermoplasmatota archaeon]|nr:endonuclease/exonuclease/phosphatase family protein [Candidatus Thermoplasmatota archaeon]